MLVHHVLTREEWEAQQQLPHIEPQTFYQRWREAGKRLNRVAIYPPDATVASAATLEKT